MTTDARIRGLYAITDPGLLPSARLRAAVEAALAGGATLVQYRNKHAARDVQLAEARSLAALCRAYGALLLVNDDARLAAEAGADGVHLGQRDGAIAAARVLLGRNSVIGQTCHDSLDLALAAGQAGADYVAFGRFFPSHTKPHASPADITLLPRARAALAIPVVAIGGVTVENAPALIAAGADALAVIHGLFAADDVAARAREFSTLFTRGLPA